MKVNRRGFLKSLAVGTVGLSVNPFSLLPSPVPSTVPASVETLSAWEILYRQKLSEHVQDLERAFLFGHDCSP